jgi:hypothetical protein
MPETEVLPPLISVPQEGTLGGVSYPGRRCDLWSPLALRSIMPAFQSRVWMLSIYTSLLFHPEKVIEEEISGVVSYDI